MAGSNVTAPPRMTLTHQRRLAGTAVINLTGGSGRIIYVLGLDSRLINFYWSPVSASTRRGAFIMWHRITRPPVLRGVRRAQLLVVSGVRRFHLRASPRPFRLV